MKDSYDNLDFTKLGYLPACRHFPIAFWVNPHVQLPSVRMTKDN